MPTSLPPPTHPLNSPTSNPTHSLTYSQPQTHIPPSSTETNPSSTSTPQTLLLWDRKSEGGFPETKVLKQRVRDRIDPLKDLGHSDVGGKKKDAVKEGGVKEVQSGKVGKEVEGGKVEDVRVDGKTERNAEEMVRDMEGEDGVVEGKVCEDCQ